MAYLHERHICHRDIKLENWMAESHSMIKLIDFGLSLVYADDQKCFFVCD